MFCLTPIPPHQFDILIGKTEHNRKAMKKRGQLQPLIVPSPEQRADGLWRDQIFIAADAVIVSALDLLVEAGAARSARISPVIEKWQTMRQRDASVRVQ